MRAPLPTAAVALLAGAVALLAPAASAQAPVPVNPSVAQWPWGVYHANSYAQASTAQRGPERGDVLSAEHLPGGRINKASPWTILGVRYADGSQPIWGATLTHVIKSVQRPDGRVEVVDTERIDYNLASVNYDLIALQNGKVYVVDPVKKRLLRYADATPGDPDSEIALDATFDYPDGTDIFAAHLNVTYDGWIVVPGESGQIIAIAPDFSDYRLGTFPVAEGDIVGHNAFPVDQDGGIYLSTQKGITKLRWTGDGFETLWRVEYRFRNPGCSEPESPREDLERTLTGDPCSGSGTTPTLMGVGPDEDRLVLVIDGHQPNNRMVAFWRDGIPDDWAGLDGYDRRVAAVTPLPYATAEGDGFNVENSPTAWGYEVATAQWNGIAPKEDPVPGVQKLRWSPQTRTLDVVWATDAVALNNILTYSDGSGLVYGTGLAVGTDVYHFYALDWATGAVVLDLALGDGDEFIDGGNQLTMLGDRSMVYGSGSAGLVHVVASAPTDPEPDPDPDARVSRLRVSPNPAQGQIRVDFEIDRPGQVELTLRDVRGREVVRIADAVYPTGPQTVTASTAGLSSGTYIVRLRTGRRSTARRFVVVQ